MASNRIKTFVCIAILALIATGCATNGAVESLKQRVGAVEQAVAVSKTAIAAVDKRVTDNAATTATALQSAADRLKGHDEKLKIHDDKFAATERTAAAQNSDIAALKTVTDAQQAANKGFMAALRAGKRGENLTDHKFRGLGVKYVECWGFASGESDLALPLKSAECKGPLEELQKAYAAGKADVLGVVGYHDTMPCKQRVPSCLYVPWYRGVAMLNKVGITDPAMHKSLITVEKPAMYGTPEQSRGAVIFWKPKEPKKASGRPAWNWPWSLSS